MGYDWLTIFKNKTNKELYNIVTGKAILPQDAILFAKQELKRRNFDFNNMEANKAGWQISDLIKEEHYAQLEITGRRAKYIHLKILFIIIPAIIVIYYSVIELTKKLILIEMLIFYIAVAIFFVLLNNFIYKKQTQAHLRRIEKIKELKEKLDQKNLLKKQSPIYQEFIRHSKEEYKGIKMFMYFAIGISLIFLFILILQMIL